MATVISSVMAFFGKHPAQADAPGIELLNKRSAFHLAPKAASPKQPIVLASHKQGHNFLPLPSMSLVRSGRVESKDTAHFVYLFFGKRGTPEVSTTAKRALEIACAWNGLGKISDRKLSSRKKTKSTQQKEKLARRGAIVLPVTAGSKPIEDGTELWKRYDSRSASDVLIALGLDPYEIWIVYSEEPLLEFVRSNPGKTPDFEFHADLISGVSEVFLSSRFEATMALIDDEQPFEYRRLEQYLARLEDGLSLFDRFSLSPPTLSIGGPVETEEACRVN